MEDLLVKYLQKHNLTRFALSQILKCTPSTITHWIKGHAKPRDRIAWKLHKLSGGEVPITYWGYIIDSKGRMKRVSDRPITNIKINVKEEAM